MKPSLVSAAAAALLEIAEEDVDDEEEQEDKKKGNPETTKKNSGIVLSKLNVEKQKNNNDSDSDSDSDSDKEEENKVKKGEEERKEKKSESHEQEEEKEEETEGEEAGASIVACGRLPSTMDQCQTGMILNGYVKRITDFGVFVGFLGLSFSLSACSLLAALSVRSALYISVCVHFVRMHVSPVLMADG